jgi:glycosyltransferase involved in cell wall biosynthesis
MRTLHVPYSFAPDPAGGTEVYVDGLCRSLEQIGIRAAVAAPALADAAYEHDGVRVRRFASSANGRLEALYGAGDPVAATAFERVLDAERPDLVHQHAVSPACSVELMRAAKRRGLPVVFTYHTPTASCPRGTLLRWGTEVCDGRLATAPCTPCALHGHGAGRVAGAIAAAVPRSVGDWLGRADIQGGVWTAARMSALIRDHHASVAALLAIPDRIVSLTPWVGALLAANGVPEARIVHVPHGTMAGAAGPVPRRLGPCRFVHVGRVDPAKGTDVLIAAMRAMSGTPCELDVLGIVQDAASHEARQRLASLAAEDSRVRFLDPVEPSAIVDRLATYDFVVVPSQWLETGPLVVLEAFAAGVPVIGSALGGLLHQVTDGVDGLLVSPFNAVSRWTDVLQQAATNRALRDRLRAGVSPPRPMAAVAREMRDVYADVLASRSRDRAPARVTV